ncbi:molybdopterin-dependent oxidoreductase [Paraurantiacibacter namhicola]|uniref:Sulfoxide reductase catalytic subunit YedY n=1 Tax=Paraurantiacibacter namhicola TaxID=645517 RepID=A0A1C7D893_9SPHN|nr:molybdopterin-dependent oxidoreductase [Paraurantiacibacter namhicola]ANU07678.1 Sulfoxide reductase catalytic subunit YedY precursor [Paraurantiacibacter namhicola]
MRRRNLLAAGAAFFAAGCSKIGKTDWFGAIVDSATSWHKFSHRAIGSLPLAPEYDRADVSPFFRGNGSQTVDTDAYRAALESGFADWTLKVSGMVDRELDLSLDMLKALPQRTQVTRHDCVEGWSAIGEWTGPQLGTILDMAGIRSDARFVLFRCADTLNGAEYYESVDMADAMHPQTIVAHALNGEALPERNGAPLRVRIERQLGYKSAKYLTGVEVVDTLEGIGGGEGGYWEDRGYQWYAGI